MTGWGFLTFSSLKLPRFGQNLNTNPKPKVLNTLYLTHASSQTQCFTHACFSHLTQLKLMPHGLWISESHNFFFSPSHPHNISVSISPFVLHSLFLGYIRYWFFFFWFWFWLLDSLSFIWSFSRCFFFIFYFLLHLRFSVHVLGFISGSPFHDFTGKW